MDPKTFFRRHGGGGGNSSSSSANNNNAVPFCSVFAKNCKDYFNSFERSTLALFTLLTTANYPDVMMPAYDCSAWSSLFFIA